MAAKVSNAQLQQQLEGFSQRFEENFKLLTTSQDQTKTELFSKIDGITTRLDSFDVRIDKMERSIQHTDTRVGELSAQLENGDLAVSQKFSTLNKRIEELEAKLAKLEGLPNKIGPLESIPSKVDLLAEKVEDRTNRQLRETLVFKNIPEEERDASYKETKELLATVISRNCPDFTYNDVLTQIKRAHRESKRNSEQNSRAGKRLIFAAFHSWDMTQKIIETFRQKCITDRAFTIAAEQKYGPMTSKRRQLAFILRRRLIDSGEIVSGYVDFPARLMVNVPGATRSDGKKRYEQHTDFSRYAVEL